MKAAKKIDIILESSTVTASTEDEFDYAGSTTYNTNDIVKVGFEDDGTTARTPVVEYEALDDGITTDYPPDSPSKWGEIGTTNRWAMFDDFILNSVTTDTTDITVAVTSNRSNIVGLFGLVGSAVTFTLTRGGSTIDTETISLSTLPSSGWYSWLYDEYEYKTKAFWEYTKYTDATLTVTITVTGGEATCGEMVLGNAVFLGNTQYGAKVGIDDYSIIDTDSLDRVYLNQGNYADRAEIDMWIENTTIDNVRRKLAELRGTLSLWDLNNEGSDYDSLRILGYFRNFDITIPGPSISYCSIEIGGAT
jgi:hypothetical protein